MFRIREVYIHEHGLGIRIALVFALVITACTPQIVNNTNTALRVNEITPSPARAGTERESSVTIKSPDGVILVGSFFESPKANSPALLLLHQWQSDRHSYDDFARRMQTRGFTVLAIDGRGFGESTKRAGGAAVNAGRTDADVNAMLGDVDAAIGFLTKQKNVDRTRIGIVGASYGSSLAIIYAADHPDIKAVALLSPGLNYFGNMPTEPAVKKYGDRPLMFLAAEDDRESADSVRKLETAADNPRHPRRIFGSGGHGTALLKVGASDELAKFFGGTVSN